MADTVELNSGSGGAVLSTDEVTKDTVVQHVQYVKLMNGTADAVDVIPGDATNGLLVNLGSNNDVTVTGTVTVDGSGVTQPVSGTVTANLAAGTNNIGDVDVLSVVPGTGATSLGKAEDAAHSGGDTGVMALAVRNDSGTALAGTSGDYIPLSTDKRGNLLVNAYGPGTIDSFGHIRIGQLYNQIDIQWYRSDGSVGDLVTETNANGGTASATNGMATFSATTSASSQAKGVSTETTVYHSGAEVYCMFTAGFTGTGSGTSYRRIGLYDTNNGFFIGYEGGTFGVTIRKGAADVQVAKASFSEDDLTGAATSQFTRAGVPEAIDLTKLNVYRIRYGWLGSAPVYWEVMSPDGKWVTFHVTRQPNNAAVPTTNTSDLPITCDVNSGNSGAALTIITNCWAAGTTATSTKLSETIYTYSEAALTRSVITGYSTAGGGAFVNVKVNPSGAITVDGSGSTQPVSGTVTANLAAGTNNIGDVDILSIAAGDNNIGNVDIVTMPNVTLAAGTNTNEVVGDVAHDAAAAGNPVGISGVAQTMDDTAPPNRVSAEGDATRLATSLDGSIFAHPHGPQVWSYHVNGSAALTDASVHAAPGSGLSLYVTDIVISSGAATAMNAFFEEGASTVLGPYYLEAVAGRGCAIHFTTPKKITANTALTVTTSAAIAHSVDVTGFTAPA